MTGFTDRMKKLRLWTGSFGQKVFQGSGRYSANGTAGIRWADPVVDTFDKPVKASSAKSAPPESRRLLISRQYVWGILSCLAIALAAAGLYWQTHWNDHQHPDLNRVLADPLRSLDEGAKTALLDPLPELSAQMKRSFQGKPDQLCSELSVLGLENRGWRRAPFQNGRWQCASELFSLTTPSVDFGPATLFVLLRGPAEDKIDYMRLKLVVEDARQKEIGIEAVWLVIDALADRYGWTVPERFRKAISEFSDLETTYRGVRLSVAPEDPNLTGDPSAVRRLNIILNFGEPDLIRPADRFEVAPPLESGWSAQRN